MVGDFHFPESEVIVFRIVIGILIVVSLGLVGVALAGAGPEPTPALAGCHGAPAQAAASCHGRVTVAQRIAARQAARQDERAARRAARASCHGEAVQACECQ